MGSGRHSTASSKYFFLWAGLFLLWPFPPAFSQEISNQEIVPKVDLPVEIKADRLEYQKEKDRYEAEGSVEILQGEMQLKASRIILENQTGDATIFGNFFFFDGQNSLEGEEGKLGNTLEQGAVEGSCCCRRRLYLSDSYC